MMLRILTCTLLVFVFGLGLTGCKDGDLETILSHVSGGANVTVDPVTGAITPGIAVNIKNARGQTLYRCEPGVPVTKAQIRAVMARGADRVEVRGITYTAASTRYISRSTSSFSPTQFSRYVVGDRIPEENPCGNTRAVAYRATTIADEVDLEVTPSMREQFRNMALLRDRRYIRNSRPAERVIERAQAMVDCTPAEVVSIPTTTVSSTTTTTTAPTINEPGNAFPDIQAADKSAQFSDIAPTALKKPTLTSRVDQVEKQMQALVDSVTRIEAKLK